MVASKFSIPAGNAYTRSTYETKLRSSGFVQIQLESIRDRVYKPMHRYLAAHPETLARLHPMARPPARIAMRLDAANAYRGLDYVLASAVKPGIE